MRYGRGDSVVGTVCNAGKRWRSDRALSREVPCESPRPNRYKRSPPDSRSVAVGTSLTTRPPLRSPRAELPNGAPAKGRMRRFEATIWAGMQYPDVWNILIDGPIKALPGHSGTLAPAAQRMPPSPTNLSPEASLFNLGLNQARIAHRADTNPRPFGVAGLK